MNSCIICTQLPLYTDTIQDPEPRDWAAHSGLELPKSTSEMETALGQTGQPYLSLTETLPGDLRLLINKKNKHHSKDFLSWWMEERTGDNGPHLQGLYVVALIHEWVWSLHDFKHLPNGLNAALQIKFPTQEF